VIAIGKIDMDSTRSEMDTRAVLAFICAPSNKRRIIWSPATTLEAMGIEQYPHHPPTRYRKMKHVLEELASKGYLVQRQRLHSHFSMKEIAFVRADHR